MKNRVVSIVFVMSYCACLCMAQLMQLCTYQLNQLKRSPKKEGKKNKGKTKGGKQRVVNVGSEYASLLYSGDGGRSGLPSGKKPPAFRIDFPAPLATIPPMNTETTRIDPDVLADFEAVLRHSSDGTPVEPELARRVRERSERLTEQLRRKYGDIDVDQLLRESRDEV